MKSLIIKFLIIISISSCVINNQTKKKITKTKAEFNLDDIYRLDSWFQKYSEEITYSLESGTILNHNNEEIGQVELDSINKKWFQTLIKKFNISVDFKNKIKSRMTDKPYALLGFHLTGNYRGNDLVTLISPNAVDPSSQVDNIDNITYCIFMRDYNSLTNYGGYHFNDTLEIYYNYNQNKWELSNMKFSSDK